MNQYIIVTNKVGMTILDLEVKDFDGFGELDWRNAPDNCGTPILGVNKVTGGEVCGIYPALVLDLEGMCLGAADDLAVNIQLDQAVNTRISYFLLFVNKNSALGGIPKNSFKCGEKLFI